MARRAPRQQRRDPDRELAEAGTPQEREKKVGSDSGFFWRLNAYWRYEAVNGGVLIECESVSLSRSIPTLLGRSSRGAVEGIAQGVARADAGRAAKVSTT